MTTKRFLKSLISLTLVATLIMSLFAVSFGTAGAAEVDTAPTGAKTTVYFQNNWKWSDVRLYAWNSSNTALAGNWPGATMTRVGNDGTYDYYKYTLPEGTTGFIFNGIKDDGSGNRDQSPDMKTIPTNNTTFYYMNWNNGNQCLASTSPITNKFPGEAETTAPTTPPTPTEPKPTDPNPTDPTTPTEPKPTEPVDPVEVTKICFRDDFSSVDTGDANVMVSFDNGSKTMMTKTVDVMSGHDMWYADMPQGASQVKFYRTNVINDSVWNTWSASISGSKTGLYCATGWGTGNWGSTTQYFAIPDKNDINNLSFGIWADIRGNADVHQTVIARKVSSSEFHLYLPSNTPENITLYTSFADLKIGSTAVTDGTAVKLDANGSYTMTFKQTAKDTSTKTATLKVYKTEGTATMLFETKRDLYTGTNNDLAGSYLDYKDAIETKGSIYLYDEEGALVNDGKDETVLKKIKGRGNSSFEASMKIYGKYAYNFNLDKKVALVDGATASKKWCLLANNPDVTMMRNTFIYSLANDAGVIYAPKTRLVDVYDNGVYLGAYIITEKVEYGKNTLMADMKNLDDGNEDANIEAYGNEDIMDDLEDHLIQKTSSFSTNGQSYSYQYTTSNDTTNWPYHQPADFKKYNYLLEFELFNRYKNEASWFVSPRTGQAVVVKYPEFATKDEMQWIISEYEKAESAIYSNNTSAIQAAVDVDSFARMYLIQELTINLDSCSTSYYMHNRFEDDGTSKLYASPVWDYDWSLGDYTGKKFLFNGSSVYENSTTLDNPKQTFVKNKALQTDHNDGTKKANYNFQAKLVHNSAVWERCRYIWSNDFVPALANYIDNDYFDANTKDDSKTEGVMLTKWLPAFTSSLKMNDARWGAFKFTGDTWGTKITTNYEKRSFNFYCGENKAGSVSRNYESCVYYLNDWTATRWNYMSNDMKLYDASLVEKYELTDVAFTATVDETDASKLTIVPSAKATKNGTALADANVLYDVYLNSKLVYSSDFTSKSYTLTLSEGKNDVYVVVSIKDEDITDQSATQSFEYVDPSKVDVTFRFKSLSAYRLAPTLVIGGVEYAMTKAESFGEGSDEEIMCWYTATVRIKANEDVEVAFTNEVGMDAKATVNVAEATTIFFGCNNLNTGTEVVDLTMYNTPKLEYILNFYKSSNNMLVNDETDTARAMTVIGGDLCIMGDISSSFELDIMDATDIQMHLIGRIGFTDRGYAIADYNLDQVISIMDATLIQMQLVQ